MLFPKFRWKFTVTMACFNFLKQKDEKTMINKLNTLENDYPTL